MCITRSSGAEGLYEKDQSAVFSLIKYLYLQVHEDKITGVDVELMLYLHLTT